MKKNLILILFLSISFSSKITDNTEKQLNAYFPNHISMDWSIYKISKDIKKSIQNIVKQKIFRDEINLWVITDQDSSKYYAMLDNVKGKSMPITFLCVFDSTPSVKHSSIIKYREPYGGEVGSKKWLSQFTAYTNSSSYKVGKEISGISGATISVNSISKGIHKLSMLIHEIIKDNSE